jgi:hypothetical protein
LQFGGHFLYRCYLLILPFLILKESGKPKRENLEDVID